MAAMQPPDLGTYRYSKRPFNDNNMNASSNQPSAHDLVSPNLARYLGGASKQRRPGRIIQQRSSNEQQRAFNVIHGHPAGSNTNLNRHNHRTATNEHQIDQRKNAAMKKKPIARRNLVIMYPSKQLASSAEMNITPDESLNMTQLLFSPGATDGKGMVHSIFSPPAYNTKMLRDVGTGVDDLEFSPISHTGSIGQCTDRSYMRGASAKNEVSLLGDHTFADHTCENELEFERDIAINIGPEKENIAPIKQAPAISRNTPKTPAKTPSKNVDDSSIDSLGEFYTPCPKTPGTKSASKFNRMEDEISYESLNTTRESKEYLLSSFGNEEPRENWEKEDRWEQHGEEESSEEEMVFVTPKQGADKRSSGSDSSEEDHFFSPLAHYPNDNDDGSSTNLMMEAKSLLAAVKTQQSLSVIQDESGDDEFFSPLVHHVSSDRATEPMSYEESGFDQFSPIPANNNAREVEEEPVEEGSTYRLINDVKSILAASKPASKENTSVPNATASQPDHRDQSKEEATDSIVAGSQTEHLFAEKSDSPFDFQLTPTPEAVQTQLIANEYSPSFSDTSSPKTQQSQRTPHLHSPSLSSLPPGALTVDFVKNCDSIETLKTILMVLNSSKRGKQLRQPRLVQFVHMRLSKLGYSDDAASRQSSNNDGNVQDESHWQHFQHDSEWNVKLPPRIVGGRRGGKSIAWSDDVKDKAEKSVTSVTLQSSLSFESIIQEKYDVSIINDATGNTSILNTPKVVQITDMPMPTSSPSIHLSYSVAESSLDMNLSESFTLGDESAYWKMNVDNIPEEEEDVALVPNMTLSQREVELSRELEEIREAYEEAKADVKRLTMMVKSIEKNEVNTFNQNLLLSVANVFTPYAISCAQVFTKRQTMR